MLIANKNTGRCKDCDENNSSIYIPPESTIKINKNDEISIHPPRGYAYIGKGSNGNNLFIADDNGGGPPCSIGCACQALPGQESGGSCSPWVGADGTWGCTPTHCGGDCIKNLAMAYKGVNYRILQGGYIDIVQGVDFLIRGYPIPAAFKEMFVNPIVTNALNSFITKIYSDSPIPKLIYKRNTVWAPSGYVMAVINIFGRAAIMPVPQNKFIALNIGGGGTAATCGCLNKDGTTATGACDIHTFTDHTTCVEITACDGDCSAYCTLSQCSAKNGNIISLYDARGYKF